MRAAWGLQIAFAAQIESHEGCAVSERASPMFFLRDIIAYTPNCRYDAEIQTLRIAMSYEDQARLLVAPDTVAMERSYRNWVTWVAVLCLVIGVSTAVSLASAVQVPLGATYLTTYSGQLTPIYPMRSLDE